MMSCRNLKILVVDRNNHSSTIPQPIPLPFPDHYPPFPRPFTDHYPLIPHPFHDHYPPFPRPFPILFPPIQTLFPILSYPVPVLPPLFPHRLPHFFYPFSTHSSNITNISPCSFLPLQTFRFILFTFPSSIPHPFSILSPPLPPFTPSLPQPFSKKTLETK